MADGGAISIFEKGSVLIKNCLFKNNRALVGGAVVINNANEVIF